MCWLGLTSSEEPRVCTGTASALLLTLCDLICPVLLLLASRQILTRALPAPVTRSLSVRRLCVRAGTPPVTCFTCFSQLQQQHETEGASPLAAVATTPSSCFLAHQVLKHERVLSNPLKVHLPRYQMESASLVGGGVVAARVILTLGWVTSPVPRFPTCDVW